MCASPANDSASHVGNHFEIPYTREGLANWGGEVAEVAALDALRQAHESMVRVVRREHVPGTQAQRRHV